MFEHLKLMARYNKWANTRINDAINAIPEEEYLRDRGAFFGSIHGTLNHLLLVDRLWRGRIEEQPYPATGLDEIVTPDRETFVGERAAEDDMIIAFVDSFTSDRLEQMFHYKTMVGIEATDKYRTVLAHMFNHASHHRGQAHGLLSMVPSDPPQLDLPYFLRELDHR